MSLASQLSRVESKLGDLRKRDRGLSVFGSASHKYRLNRPLVDSEIEEFESSHEVKLPSDYRWFVRSIGNGGAGPFYGLGRLESGIFADMDDPTKDYVLNPAERFPYSEPWNLVAPGEEFDESLEDEYFRTYHASGLLRLCNFGCGVFINLVVNGDQYGNMWTDDRVNGNGIHPSVELGNTSRLSFIDWYEYWLDSCLADL